MKQKNHIVAPPVKTKEAFLEEYKKLCEKWGFVHVARGRLEQVDGAVFRVVGMWSIEPIEDKPGGT